MAVMALSTLYLTVLLLSLGHAELTDPPPGGCCSAGVPGSPGHNGQPGRDGRDGKDGRDGATGPKGDRGEPGEPAPCKMGPPGPPGKMGPAGLPGNVGPDGPPGKIGPAGPPGNMGPAGPPGPRGEKGDMGVTEHDINSMMLRISLVEKAASFRIFRKVGGKYYATEGLQGDYDAGLKFCRDAGGDLALPQNEEENDVLVKMLSLLGAKGGWLGLTDSKTEGTFLDTHGSSLTFTKWRSGEPNNNSGGKEKEEDCGIIERDNRLWNDVGCKINTYIVCEITN